MFVVLVATKSSYSNGSGSVMDVCWNWLLPLETIDAKIEKGEH